MNSSMGHAAGTHRPHSGDGTMLIRVSDEYVSVPIPQPTPNTATGMRAFSIWMKCTLRYRYAALPSHRVPAQQHALLSVCPGQDQLPPSRTTVAVTALDGQCDGKGCHDAAAGIAPHREGDGVLKLVEGQDPLVVQDDSATRQRTARSALLSLAEPLPAGSGAPCLRPIHMLT